MLIMLYNISSDFENYYINPKIYHTSTKLEKKEKIQIKIMLKNSRIQKKIVIVLSSKTKYETVEK